MAKKFEPWKSRITGHGEEDPAKLVANPRNWRSHPDNQRAAMNGALDEIGWIDDVTINTTTGLILDGHLRVALAVARGEPSVPVKYVELSEKEEALALATLDPIAAQAGADAAKLDELLRDVSTGNAALQSLLSEVSAAAGIAPDFQPVGIDEQGRLDQKKPIVCPECGHEFVPK